MRYSLVFYLRYFSPSHSLVRACGRKRFSKTFIMKTRSRNFLSLLAAIFLAQSVIQADNLVKNGDFTVWNDNVPSDWIIRSKQEYAKRTTDLPSDVSSALGVKLISGGKGYGEIVQKLTIEPNSRYVIKGQIWSESPKLGFFQIKRFADGKEVERISTARNDGKGWTQIEKSFHSGSSEQMQVLLRWQQGGENIGKSLAFTDVSLQKLPPLVYEGEEVPPRAVQTFNSVGLYWKPTGGTESRSVNVNYRKKGEPTWREALPLWFDTTEHPEAAAEHTAEYRGSIVYLDSGTTYEVKLKLQDGPERIIEFDTWSDDFKIARKVTLPQNHEGTYVITEGGSEATGYVLYEPAAGSEPVWDVKDEARSSVKIDASWVIFRGMTLKGGANHGIELGDVNHVVIEDCDISEWGATMDNGQARNLNSAIYSNSKELENIVVQRCNLHHPRSDSNSWKEKRPGTKSSHPEGPQGITFAKGKGRYVIRFNKIHSDIDHMFNDGMGEVKNFGFGGFPNRDSDINDNYVSHCWDDALEIEGADMNVRVWNNYMDMTYGAIGLAAPSLGPVYVFRNVYAVSRKHSGIDPNSFRGHYLVKLGNRYAKYTKGRMFIFHNTTLQPPPFEEFTDASSGAQAGIAFTSTKNLQDNITTRNNMLQMRKDKDWAIRDTQKTWSNDFDYDMHNGSTLYREGSQKNGIVGAPTYERAPDGRLWLVPGTLGYDAGERIPNFNDNYTGEAPDIGAVETNSKTPKPELWPAFPENYSPPVVADS